MTATLERTSSTRKASGKRSSKPTRGHYVIRWVETHCVYTQGRWIGKRVRLLPWQKRWLLRLFEIDPTTGLRKIRWALLGLPKKNGKTELAAWLALYFLIGDGEPSPLVACAAGSDEQADLVFGAARRCAEMSPTLSQITDCFEKEILVPSIPGAKLRRLSASVGTNDGPSWSAVICDELHEWTGPKGEGLWNVLTNGTGAREQPMVLQITTAGYDRETVCFREYEKGRRIASGEVDDPAYLFDWTEAAEGADFRDPAVWQASNPSYRVIVNATFYADQLNRKTENVFRRYFLNQWTSSEEAWLPFGSWLKVAGKSEQPARLTDVVLGFDGSFNNDSTALVGVTVAEKPHVFVVKVWEKQRGDTDAWRVPIEAVEEEIRKACRTWTVLEIACDPARWARSYQVLSDEGLPVEEFPQSPMRMVPATQQFYEAVINCGLTQDGDAALARHVGNAMVKTDGRGTRITKDSRSSSRKIDLAVAAVMAFARAVWWLHNKPKRTSFAPSRIR